MSATLPAPEDAGGTPGEPREDQFDRLADVIVVGTGMAGYSAAITARAKGAEVIQLEKAPAPGGTTRKAGGWVWIPNNPFMQDKGISDERAGFLRYVARLARPHQFNPDDANLGLRAWQIEKLGVFYDRGAEALRQLSAWGAVRLQHGEGVPDYYAQLPENTAPTGRCMFPNQLDQPDGPIGSGQDIVDLLDRTARESGVDILLEHAVKQVIMSAGRVVGVQVDTREGTKLFGARRGVVFATGGFTHNQEMRDNFLSGPLLGGCAAQTNTGDFVPIASSVGAKLLNMNYALMSPMILDIALENAPTSTGTWRMGGDSMIWVNKLGRRVCDEKAMYHELAQVFHTWDPGRVDYPNLVMVALWDQGSEDHYRGELIPGYSYTFGNPLVMGGDERPHVLVGDTLPDLVGAVRARLAEVSARLGGFQLDASFEKELQGTIERFNDLAALGEDVDFHRGETPMPLFFNGPARPGNEANPTMYPISSEGPYYATLMTAASIDTNGGPETDSAGRVLDRHGEPVPGLYGVGNCVASPLGKAYPAAGATLGPYLVHGYLAGESVAQDPGLQVSVTHAS